MPEALTSTQLFARLKDDDQDAWTVAVGEYRDRLVALATTKLNSHIRQKEDAEDIVQTVFRTFHRRVVRTKQIQEVRHSLWTLLVTITVRKCFARAEYYGAQKRDVRRETRPTASPGESGTIWDVFIAPTPSDVEAGILTETVEQLIQSTTGTKRDVLLLHLQEYSVQKIADKLDCAGRTVQLALADLKKLLVRILDGEC